MKAVRQTWNEVGLAGGRWDGHGELVVKRRFIQRAVNAGERTERTGRRDGGGEKHVVLGFTLAGLLTTQGQRQWKWPDRPIPATSDAAEHRRRVFSVVSQGNASQHQKTKGLLGFLPQVAWAPRRGKPPAVTWQMLLLEGISAWPAAGP